MRRGLHIVVGLLLGMTLLSCGSSHRKGEQTVSPLPVRILEVGERTAVMTHTYVGTIEEERRVPLSMDVSGQVVEVGCRIGERVRQGDVLLRVDSAAAKDAYEVAAATLRQAEDGYRRVAEVHEAGGVTEQQFVEIQTKLAQAQAMASMAVRRVTDCTLKSPCNAVIGDVSVVMGQTVTPAVPVLTLLMIDRLYVSFAVPEDEIAAVRIGDRGYVEVPAAGMTKERRVPVRVVEKGMRAHALSHTYAVRAEILRTDSLLPGMVSQICMDRQQKQGVVIPVSCVHVAPGGHYVWVVRANDVAEKQTITVGAYIPEGVLVTSGLQAGDRIIVDGFHKLYKGCQVVF